MKDYIWVVEEKWYKNEWIAWPDSDHVHYYRKGARQSQKRIRRQEGRGVDLRIRKYVREEEWT